MVQGDGRLEKRPDFCNAEDGGETVGGLRPHQRQRVPITVEDVRGEEAEAAGAEAHGSWGQAVAEVLCGEQVGRFGIELSQQAYLMDVGLRRPLSLPPELKRGNPVLTQGDHERSPFVRERVVCLSKGGHRQRRGSSTADISRIKALPRQRLT